MSGFDKFMGVLFGVSRGLIVILAVYFLLPSNLKEAETQQLAATLAFYKANRKRFANSSAVQGLIKQA